MEFGGGWLLLDWLIETLVKVLEEKLRTSMVHLGFSATEVSFRLPNHLMFGNGPTVRTSLKTRSRVHPDANEECLCYSS